MVRLARGSALTGVAGVVIALTAGGGSASAEPVSLTQKYTCKFPIINNDGIEAAITTDMPATMKVGETVPEYDIKAVTKVSARAAQGLGVMGAVTLEGKATADVVVTQPGSDGTLPIKVVNTVAKADIPDPAAAFEVTATGKSPGGLLTWGSAGNAAFDVKGLKLHDMIARDAAGKPVPLPPNGDEFTAECTLDAGQKTLLHTMKITGDGGTDPTDPPTNPPTDPPTGAPTDPPTGPPTDPGPTDPTDPGTTSGGSSGGGSSTSGGAGSSGGSDSSGTQLDTQVTGGSGELATTGMAGVGLMLAAAGGLSAAGIAAFHYLPRRIRRDEQTI